MSPQESSYPTTASTEKISTAEAHEKDLKTNLLNMIKVLKEEMNESHKEIKENVIIIIIM